MYVPPHNSTDQFIDFSPALIPTDEDSIITGDLNAHSKLWDNRLPPNDCSELVEDWLIEKKLSVINDGSPTRVNKATGNVSTPDVTLVGKKWNSKCAWETGEQLGSSDHLLTNQDHCQKKNNPPANNGGNCPVETWRGRLERFQRRNRK